MPVGHGKLQVLGHGFSRYLAPGIVVFEHERSFGVRAIVRYGLFDFRKVFV
jgi:hypothetical protein